MLLINDLTREMALRLSKREDGTLLRLLLGDRREGVKTDPEEELEVSVVDKFGTETLLGFVDIELVVPDVTVLELDADALLSLPDAACRGSDPLPKLPALALLLDPSQAIE